MCPAKDRIALRRARSSSSFSSNVSFFPRLMIYSRGLSASAAFPPLAPPGRWILCHFKFLHIYRPVVELLHGKSRWS